MRPVSCFRPSLIASMLLPARLVSTVTQGSAASHETRDRRSVQRRGCSQRRGLRKLELGAASATAHRSAVKSPTRFTAVAHTSCRGAAISFTRKRHLFSVAPMPAFSIASRPSKSSDILLPDIFRAALTASVACCAHHVQSFDLDQKFLCRGLWGLGFNEQSFGADEQVPAGLVQKMTLHE